MVLTLYVNKSDTNEVNKNLEEVKVLSGDLRIPTSLEKPSFDIESSYDIVNDFEELVTSDNDEVVTSDSDDVGYQFSGNIFNINYIYCQEFKRYYYVEDIIIQNNLLFTFVCKVDVLMSLKFQFLQLDAIVSRNEFIYNNMIEDEKAPYEFYQNVLIDNITYSDELIFRPSTYVFLPTFAITYMQNNAYADNTPMVDTPDGILPNVNINGIGSGLFAKTRFIKRTELLEVANYFKEHESDASFILSIIAYPFNIPYDNDTIEPLKVGNHQFNNAFVYDGKSPNGSMSRYFQMGQINGYALFDNANYLDFEPYTKYEIFLPYYGYMDLKSSDIKDSIIKIYYSFDWTNGTAIINIVNDTKGYVIKSLNANVGVILSINRTNQQQLNDERTQLAIKSTISALTGALSIGVGIGTSNPFLIRGGVTTIGSTAVDVGEKLALQHERGQTANNSGFDGCYGMQNIILKRTKYIRKEINNFDSYYGKPLNQTYNLSELSGYTEIKEIHLDNINATKTEIDELYDLLLRGIRL